MFYKHLGNEYEEYRKSAKTGTLGKMTQYCLICVSIMRNQQIAYTTTHENNYCTRLYAWKDFLHLYFS